MAVASFGPPEILKLVLASLIWAELIGVPVAWIKLRRTSAWADRPEGVRSIDLLARFVGRITGLAGAWAVVICASALLVSGIS